MRPALISAELYELLDELRRFRHFFRHAYGVELDADKVGEAVGKAILLREPFHLGMMNFLDRLGE